MPAFPDGVMKNATIALVPRQTLSQVVDVIGPGTTTDIAGGIGRRPPWWPGRDLLLKHATTTKIEDMTLLNPFKPRFCMRTVK